MEHPIWPLLQNPQLNAKGIIAALSQDAELAKLYAADAGVWEGFTIAEHTLMVFENLRDQFPVFHKKFDWQMPESLRLQELLRLTVALHDIGKPIAIAKGDKKLQHEFTLQILTVQLKKLAFLPPEVRLAEALVGHDFLGEMVKGRASAAETLPQLSKLAKTADVEFRNYFPLQAMFYCIDAAAYPSLRQRIFTKTFEGLLVPDRDSFYQLCELANCPIR